MTELLSYIKEGVFHIFDSEGPDHLYFIISISLLYSIKSIRQLVIMVTAFTIGHSLTLALAAYNIIIIKPSLIELLIPVTILITILYNFYLILKDKSSAKGRNILYLLILFFGFIHGMGFSNFLSAITFDDDFILIPLLGLNIGIEIAQLIIVFIFIILKFLLSKLIKEKIIMLVVNTILFFLVLEMIFL